MDIQKILHACDHTLLKQTATWPQIKELCQEALDYGTASVCIPPCYVAPARNFCGDMVKICTVIGFPNGYMTAAAKGYEAQEAVAKGADEIDMVINIGMLKSGIDQYVLDEIKSVKTACQGKTLKVIIETCLLTEEEKIRMCRIVSEAGADYIKTSTGFSVGGATVEDVKLFRKHLDPKVKIKAAGGISTLEDAWALLEAGADRLGTSRIVKLAQAYEG